MPKKAKSYTKKAMESLKEIVTDKEREENLFKIYTSPVRFFNPAEIKAYQEQLDGKCN